MDQFTQFSVVCGGKSLERVRFSVPETLTSFCVVSCSELQTEALRRQSFEQKCESWMSFLQRMEDGLAVDVAGSYVSLRQQLCTHKVPDVNP